jgi:hypothetical protein
MTEQAFPFFAEIFPEAKDCAHMEKIIAILARGGEISLMDGGLL